ncbi:hypothetical protein RDWZM_001599, partial [Blomia tropicalis]
EGISSRWRVEFCGEFNRQRRDIIGTSMCVPKFRVVGKCILAQLEQSDNF